MPERHELLDFIIAETTQLETEYERLQRRVREDPGTAGDEGEENWATILRHWLPAEYYVVTKGRILGHKGTASPQVDVVVLSAGYPPKLRDRKLYFAGGVSAAFECKLTLKKGRIKKTIDNCVRIKRLTARRTGTPYLELTSPLLYGLLAHSHSWKGGTSTPVPNITKQIAEQDLASTSHPREMLDIVCIADLSTWTLQKTAYWPTGFPFLRRKMHEVNPPPLDPFSEKTCTLSAPAASAIMTPRGSQQAS